MGTLVQRKAFDHVELAKAAAAGFHDPQFAIPGLTISTNVVEADGYFWAVLSQQGYMVTEPGPILPEYELVSFAP